MFGSFLEMYETKEVTAIRNYPNLYTGGEPKINEHDFLTRYVTAQVIFAISKIIPVDDAVKYLKEQVNKTYGAKGLAFSRLTEEGTSSSFEKFLTEEEKAALYKAMELETGDVLLIVSDADWVKACTALGQVLSLIHI